MEVRFDNPARGQPAVSIILLDWTCRESFHTLQYLKNQTVPREQYQVIWIEYFDRRAEAIEAELAAHRSGNGPPVVDQWIILDMPRTVYYHKHLMYNVGLVASRGDIIVLCDSDAMVKPTFVESVIRAFRDDPEIVLHLDEVRNTSRRLHPFNYPSFDRLLGKGCLNWKDGVTTGLLEEMDVLHKRNYGACFCARRADLIQIGGADEHIHYLGHVCGPYEMTFRLVNAGKKELWHQREFLYHTWHPGTDGTKDYFGPHDMRGMSLTALKVRQTGRVMPLVENSAIRTLRLAQDQVLYGPGRPIGQDIDHGPRPTWQDVNYGPTLLEQAIPEEELKNWRVGPSGRTLITGHATKRGKRRRPPPYGGQDIDHGPRPSAVRRTQMASFIQRPASALRRMVLLSSMLIRQFRMRVERFSRKPKSLRDILRKILKVREFMRTMRSYNSHVVESCTRCLDHLAGIDVREFALYGSGEVAEVFYRLALDPPYGGLEIRAVYDRVGGKKFFGHDVLPVEALKDYRGKIVVAALVDVQDKAQALRRMGVDKERIVLL